LSQDGLDSRDSGAGTTGEQPFRALSAEPGRTRIPALVGALVSVFLLRSGFLTVFFLIPLGVVGFSFGRGALWRGALTAVILNALCLLGLSLWVGRGFGGFLPDLGFYVLMVTAFAWLVAPPLGGPAVFRIRASYRLVLGALAGALLGVGFTAVESAGLQSFIQSQAELLSSLYVSAAGGDAVRRSLLEQELSPERIVSVFNLILVRGGALASVMVIFFVSRQFSLGLAALIRRRRFREGGFSVTGPRDFHVPPLLIWVFSGSLAGILLFRIAGLTAPETVVWNLLMVSVLMYLAQGLGIVQTLLGRRDMPAPLRIVINIGIILVVFSPGLNMGALGLLMLLGIVEHWVPLRARIARKSQP
jgi:hypothetical protein